MTTNKTRGLFAPASPQSDAVATRDCRQRRKPVVRFHLAYAVPDLIRDDIRVMLPPSVYGIRCGSDVTNVTAP